MPYVIKRYANRKLYDTRTKRYLTLEEIAVLVRAGEEVRVEDADTGEELTGQVLARIVAEGGRKGGPLVSQKLLVDLIQRPGEAVLGAVRSSVHAGQRTVEQVGGEVGKLIETVSGMADRGRKQVGGVGDEVARVVEGRLRALLAEMDIATRADLGALEARVAKLESAVRRAQRQASRKKVAEPAAKGAARRAKTAPKKSS